MYELAMRIAEEEAKDKKHRREGTAVALRLKQPSTIDVEEYFPAFLEMVKNLLDGKSLDLFKRLDILIKRGVSSCTSQTHNHIQPFLS